MTDAPPPQHPPVSHRLLAAALAAGVALVAVRRVASAAGNLLVWSDRDVVRSSVPYGDLPTVGAELSFGSGARVPGGALHSLWWAALQVDPSPTFVWRVQVALDGLGLAVVGAVLARALGPLPAAVGVAAAFGTDATALTQQTLWNPAWVSPLAAVAVACWVHVLRARDGRWLVPAGLCVGLAAHAHVTALLLVPALLPGLWGARAGWRWALAGLASLVATYVPYLLDEVRHGWPNTRLLVEGGQLDDHTHLVGATAAPLHTASGAVAALAGRRVLGWLGEGTHVGVVWVALALLAGLTVAALVAAVASRDVVRRDVGRGVLAALALYVGWIARTRSFEFGTSDAVRYLVAAGPLVATLAAVGAGELLARAAGRGRVVALVVAVSLAALSGLRPWAVGRNDLGLQFGPQSGPRLQAWVGALAARTGWSLAEVAARTVVLVPQGGGALWRLEAAPIEPWLRAEGATFAGSGTPPCASVLVTVGTEPAPPVDPVAWAAALGPDVDAPVLASDEALIPGVSWQLYTPTGGRCPSSMSDRYLPTDEELAVWDAARGLHTGEAVATAEGWALWVEAAPGRPWSVPLAVGVRLARQGDQVVATLVSNALRGYAANAGLYVVGRLRTPTLVGRAADGSERVRLPFAGAVVGRGGALTPLSVSGLVPADVVSWSFTYTAEPDALAAPGAAPGTGVVVDIALPAGAR